MLVEMRGRRQQPGFTNSCEGCPYPARGTALAVSTGTSASKVRSADPDMAFGSETEEAMSHPLLEYIHARFRESFGPPYSTLGRDSQWSLRASLDGDGRLDGAAPTIFVLVNGSHEKPAAWIFDPFDGVDNVWKSSITAESDVESAIIEINRRLAAVRSTFGGRRDGALDGDLTRGG
jgi:hypothetical protein